MYELLLPIINTYPGWSLMGLVFICLAIIEAIPSTARALRGKAPVVINNKESESTNPFGASPRKPNP